MVNTLKLHKIFSLTFTLILAASNAFSAAQSSYPTKTAPVSGDKALITDSADSNKTKQAALSAFLVGDCTGFPCLDGSSDGGNLIKLYAGTGSYWTALQGGAPAANRSWRLPIAAAPAAGETLVMTMDQYGQMGFLAAPETSGYVLSSTDAGVLSWIAGGGGTDYLSLTNTTPFTPDADYEPATKKYVDDAITAGGGYTDEMAQDAVGGMFTGNTETGITVTYDDATAKVNFAVATQFDGSQSTSGSAGSIGGMVTASGITGPLNLTKTGTTARTVTFPDAAGTVALTSNIPAAVTDATITTTDVTTNNASTTKHGWLLKATAPSSGLRNIVAIDNGETVYKNAALFDATSPSTQAFGDTASVGNAMTSARRDHKHAMPAAQTATTTAFTPNGSIAATTVQNAIQEVRDEAGTVPGTGIPRSTTGTSFDAVLGLVTTVGATGADTNIPSEQAVREAIDALPLLTWGTGLTNNANTISVTANTYQAYDANMITWPSAVSATEVGYLDGVTSAIQTQLGGKQETLVSGTNIKTINGTTLLGSGNITTSGSMIYPGAGVPVSTGSAWGTSLTAPSGAIVGTSDSQTLTNKTFDVEGTGNSVTIVDKIWFASAGCNNATATSFYDLPTSNAPSAACITGTNTQKGVLDFDAATAESAQVSLALPSDWAGNIGLKYKWLAAATSGDVVWAVQTSCVADAETDDPSWNTASTVTDAAKGTTLQTNDASITSITATGCAAGELLHLKFYRDAANGSDTMTGDARLIGAEVTIRRAQ